MKRIFTVGLLLFTILLVGCTGDNVATAVEYIEALNQRNLEEVNDYVCAEQADEITESLMSVTGSEDAFSFVNVSCAARGGDVLCRYSISQESLEDEDVNITQDREVTFEFEDGQICGFEQQVAN